MPLFRRIFDRNHAVARPAAPHDISTLRALGYHATQRYLTSSVDELVELAMTEPTAVLEYDRRMVAVAQVGWRMPPHAWLRSVLVDNRVEPGFALPLVIEQAQQLLPARAIEAVYITLDEWTEPWLRPSLDKLGYRHIMEVWTYDKLRMDVPSQGNQSVVVRRGRADDLQTVLRLDTACFPPPWGKGEEILRPALITAPYFSVAEWAGDIIGYTYVTMHQGGLHAHLVRIAVLPQFQGNGIGVRLLAEVVRFCQHRRVELLSLNTQDGNTGAQRLYEWFGFERTGETQIVLGRDLPGQS